MCWMRFLAIVIAFTLDERLMRRDDPTPSHAGHAAVPRHDTPARPPRASLSMRALPHQQASKQAKAGGPETFFIPLPSLAPVR